jgi:hypothetical protein
MRNQGRLLLLAFAAAMIAGNAHAGIINPSFETGDLTGWNITLGRPIVGHGGTDGEHYLTATVMWMRWPSVDGDPTPPTWGWNCGLSQTLSVPVDATTLTFDVRTCGLAPGGWTFQLMHMTMDIMDTLPNIDFFASNNYAVGAGVPVGGGFVRYTLDISGAAGLDNVELWIGASGSTYSFPTDPVEFSIDNIQIIPEPGTVALLAAGGLLLVGRRGGPRRASRVP